MVEASTNYPRAAPPSLPRQTETVQIIRYCYAPWLILAPIFMLHTDTNSQKKWCQYEYDLSREYKHYSAWLEQRHSCLWKYRWIWYPSTCKGRCWLSRSIYPSIHMYVHAGHRCYKSLSVDASWLLKWETEVHDSAVSLPLTWHVSGLWWQCLKVRLLRKFSIPGDIRLPTIMLLRSLKMILASEGLRVKEKKVMLQYILAYILKIVHLRILAFTCAYFLSTLFENQ